MGVKPLSSRERQLQKKTQFLPWIVNPLTNFLRGEQHESHAHHRTGSEGKGSNSEHDTVEDHEEIEEATPIELFYDLFFVANLTTVTSVHAINDNKSLASYVLFFIILWFTWLQVTLYDIRFSVDSVYERICKAFHFAVMIGFSSVSTKWNPFDSADPKTTTALKTMTLVLMASRLVLAFQYGTVLVYAVKAKKVFTPLAIHSFTMLLASMAYLGLFFAFNNNNGRTSTKTYVAWYIICPLEAVAVIASSSIWRIVSFKSTHLVERLGLLTLIVIGEGIIVMLKAVNTVAKASAWDGSSFGVVLSALAIIYFYWMYYFDYTPQHSHYGTIRQQVWAVLHFPLHLAIVLSVEGLRQFTTYFSFTKEGTKVLQVLNSADPFSGVNKTLNALYNDGSSKTILLSYKDNQKEMNELIKSRLASKTETEATPAELETVGRLLSDLLVGYSEYFGLKTPKSKKGAREVYNPLDPAYDPLGKTFEVFDLVVLYFFISLGCLFCMYGILGFFVRRRKDVYDYLSIALRFVVATIFFSILAVRNNIEVRNNFIKSAWPLPTVALILFVSLIVDKIINWIAYKHMKGVAKKEK
ncbi:bacterial low temperature requirement A protein-domain-containing protein [Geopyxis carbonaria]|nr:bacterial low temperature requirement A protein-domain-containing protein [Geopyxis carbonaria]